MCCIWLHPYTQYAHSALLNIYDHDKLWLQLFTKHKLSLSLFMKKHHVVIYEECNMCIRSGLTVKCLPVITLIPADIKYLCFTHSNNKKLKFGAIYLNNEDVPSFKCCFDMVYVAYGSKLRE